jgi:hypothetical protein
VMGPFVAMGCLVMVNSVMGHFVLGRCMMGRFVCVIRIHNARM